MNNSSSANHKTLKASSNGANSRLTHHKPMKLDITMPMPLNYQPPSVITVKTKDTGKDNGREKKVKMSPIIKLNNNSKQHQQQQQQQKQQLQQQQLQQLQQKQDQQSSKRMEIKDAPSRATGGSNKIQCIDRHFAVNRKMEPQQQHQQQHQQLQQQQLQQQQQHLKQLKKSRQYKDDPTTSKSKVDPAVVEGFSTKAHKEPKQPEKGDAPARPVRTKNQSHNTKIFFDKYLKFAYDLSTPSGVRQLEEHFFPVDPNAGREPARSKANPYAKVLRAACEQGEKPKGSEGFES